MRLFKRRRPRLSSAGMGLAGAMSIASQMALLCPPSFDEWVRQELVAGMKVDDRRNGHAGRPR
ncbi:MAG TPA: hypothetical protein VGO66_12825 [Solirubrobacterales bacterium]|nr:hypothetical protein [Solirubrobacterales bacterium]